MTKPTPNQLRANRQNARKCTGPKTAAGKSASSQNAITHGFYAKDLILRHKDWPEDPAEFDELLADLVRDFAPQTRIERSMVSSIAASLWRQRRAHRYEACAMARSLNGGKSRRAMGGELEDVIKILTGWEEQWLKKSGEQMERLQNAPAADDAEATQDYQRFVKELAQQHGCVGTGNELVQQLSSRLRNIGLSAMAMIQYARATLAKSPIKMNDAENPDGDVLLPPLEEMGKLVRYENMVNRQLHRALNELRRIRMEAKEETNE